MAPGSLPGGYVYRFGGGGSPPRGDCAVCCTCNGEGRCIVCVESDVIVYRSANGGATPHSEPRHASLYLRFRELEHETPWPCVVCGDKGADAVADSSVATHAHIRCLAQRTGGMHG